MRIFWALVGILAVAFGTIGVVLPLIPTVPFMILAAFCFAKSSPRLHDWLINHKVFGPSIQDWRDKGAISLRGKQLATVSVAFVFALSLILGLRFWVLAIQGTALIAVLTFIWSRPTGSLSESDKARQDHPNHDS
jgi:uncharacterized membrane protein YbaN (DUF454 family)